MKERQVIARPANRSDHGNITEMTYERLRSDIIHGVLRPNERLIETELAERLQVSRTPIRESLQRLAADGLLVSRGRGWVIYEYTADEIREIYEVRAALESYAVRLATMRASDERISEIVSILGTSGDIVHAPRQHMVEVNDRFHDALIESSGNRRLIEAIKRNRQYYFNVHIAALYTDEDVAHSRSEHEEIVHALVDRDADRAEEATRRHILGALKILFAKVR